MRDAAKAWVIKCFEYMGASPEQLAVESQRLSEDDFYLDSWCKVTGFKPT